MRQTHKSVTWTVSCGIALTVLSNLIFIFTYGVHVCMPFVHVWLLVYWGAHRYTSVCVCMSMHMGVTCTCGMCTCGGLRLMSASTLHCSSTLFNKARTFSQIQSSLMWLVLLSSLLWGSHTSTFPGWRYRRSAMPSWQLCVFWGSEPGSLSLRSKPVSHGASP